MVFDDVKELGFDGKFFEGRGSEGWILKAGVLEDSEVFFTANA